MDDIEISQPVREKDEEFCLSWCKSRFQPATLAVGCGSENKAKVLRYDEMSRKWNVISVIDQVVDLIHDVSWAPSIGRFLSF
jgi:nucleoporin SEH1